MNKEQYKDNAEWFEEVRPLIQHYIDTHDNQSLSFLADCFGAMTVLGYPYCSEQLKKMIKQSSELVA